jgi:hypothetical protein
MAMPTFTNFPCRGGIHFIPYGMDAPTIKVNLQLLEQMATGTADIPSYTLTMSFLSVSYHMKKDDYGVVSVFSMDGEKIGTPDDFFNMMVIPRFPRFPSLSL